MPLVEVTRFAGLREALSKAPEERPVCMEQYAPPELMREGSRTLGTGRPSGTLPDSHLDRQLR